MTSKREKDFRYLSTSDLARSVGVHPNTVRRYVDSALIPPVERSENGYRRFTQHHLYCLQVACIIYRSTYPTRGIRASAREVLLQAIAGDWGEALEKSHVHLRHVQSERRKAEAAVQDIDDWRSSAKANSNRQGVSIGDAAEALDVTVDMLRNWERNGLVVIPRLQGNAYRVYGGVELSRLRVIRALAKAGYSQMAILRMLLQLDKDADADVRQALDTPRPEDDVYSASDRWLSTLADQETVAQRLIALVQAIKVAQPRDD